MAADPEAAPPGKIRTAVTHLAMDAAPGTLRPPCPPGVAVRRRRDMPVADYLRLYRAVGGDWLWWQRLVLDEAALAAHLRADETELHVAEADGEAVGFAELDRRPAPDVELRYFGVVGPRIGTGLGGCLLAHALAAAWRHRPRRVILETCDCDHPRALGFYRKHGFSVVRQETEVFDDPRLRGLLPRDSAPHVPLAAPPAR